MPPERETRLGPREGVAPTPQPPPDWQAWEDAPKGGKGIGGEGAVWRRRGFHSWLYADLHLFQ